MNEGYSMDRTYLMKRYWKKFMKYCYNKGIYNFDVTIANEFINSYDVEKKQNKNEAIRAILILNDFEEYKQISKMPMTKILADEIKLNTNYKSLLNRYLTYSKDIKQNSDRTLKEKKQHTSLFFLYLQNNNVKTIQDFNKSVIMQYINEIEKLDYSPKIEKFYHLRSIMNYIRDEEENNLNYLYLIPKTKRINQRNVPTVFEKNDIDLIIEQLKKDILSSSAGYRNYAMILMLAIYGIRFIDIKYLQWNSIDWKKNIINIIQHKTKVQLTLPLYAEVGNAIIDYIKNERPHMIKDKEEYIFIRHRFPFDCLSAGYNGIDIIKRAAERCNVNMKKYKKKGTHNFRYTLATELLNNEVPSNIISSILGHSNIKTTKTYLRIDEKHLKNCFVEDIYE